LPGLGDALVCADADEHTPAGHLTEDPQIRRQQVLKRLKKYLNKPVTWETNLVEDFSL